MIVLVNGRGMCINEKSMTKICAYFYYWFYSRLHQMASHVNDLWFNFCFVLVKVACKLFLSKLEFKKSLCFNEPTDLKPIKAIFLCLAGIFLTLLYTVIHVIVYHLFLTLQRECLQNKLPLHTKIRVVKNATTSGYVAPTYFCVLFEDISPYALRGKWCC